LTQPSSSSYKVVKFKKICQEVFIVGVLLHVLHIGLINSVETISLPQPSHWSPQASSYPHKGHVPDTNLSANGILQVRH